MLKEIKSILISAFGEWGEFIIRTRGDNPHPSGHDITNKFSSQILSLISDTIKECVGEEEKCDGDNGCGYDGSQEDNQIFCGGSVPSIHPAIASKNQKRQEILNKLKEKGLIN